MITSIAYLILLAVIAWWVYRIWYRWFDRRCRERVDADRAMDIFRLHPGTKAIWDADAAERGEDPFRGYLLPSGRVVRHRYWWRLAGRTPDGGARQHTCQQAEEKPDGQSNP